MFLAPADGVATRQTGRWMSRTCGPWRRVEPFVHTSDEHVSGRVDTERILAGAVNGIDDDSIMGQYLTVVMKRHCGGVIIMNRYDLDYDYEVMDK